MSKQQFTGLSKKKIEQIMQSRKVQAALERRASSILPRAKAIAISAGAEALAGTMKIERGTRPGTKARGGLKRPYVRVTAELTPEVKKADRGAKLTAKQITRRAASGS